MIDTTQFLGIFNKLTTSVTDGVYGVIKIDSGKPGPVLGITACTHGNEPSGLAVVDYLLNEINIEKKLEHGTLYLVLNNICATEKFFRATSEAEIRQSRYCDVNMNRLPKNTLELKGESRYEVLRAQDLYSIWNRFEYGLDIHSTLDPSDPMIISRGGEFHPELVRGFPIVNLISNIDKIQIGIPALAFYGGINSSTKAFVVESGQHSDPESFKRATVCAISLLQNLNMLPHTGVSIDMEYDEYHIDASIVFPNNSFDFVENFKSYEVIHKGDLLARNLVGTEIRSTMEGHLIMPTSRRGADKDISEEVAFVSLPVKKRKVV